MPVTQEKLKEIIQRIVEEVDPYRKRNLSTRELFPMRDFGLDVFVFKPDEFDRQKSLANSISSIVSKEGKVVYEREGRKGDEHVRAEGCYR